MNDQELGTFMEELHDVLKAFGIPYPVSSIKHETDGSTTISVVFSLGGRSMSERISLEEEAAGKLGPGQPDLRDCR